MGPKSRQAVTTRVEGMGFKKAMTGKTAAAGHRDLRAGRQPMQILPHPSLPLRVLNFIQVIFIKC